MQLSTFVVIYFLVFKCQHSEKAVHYQQGWQFGEEANKNYSLKSASNVLVQIFSMSN